MKQKSIYFYLAVVGIFFAICSPRLLSYGMFLDGTTYASIAQNMAVGKGTFWMPYYTETLCSTFYGQPPLALWLESLFFRLLGTSLFVERFYSVLSICLVGFLIAKRTLHYSCLSVFGDCPCVAVSSIYWRLAKKNKCPF